MHREIASKSWEEHIKRSVDDALSSAHHSINLCLARHRGWGLREELVLEPDGGVCREGPYLLDWRRLFCRQHKSFSLFMCEINCETLMEWNIPLVCSRHSLVTPLYFLECYVENMYHFPLPSELHNTKKYVRMCIYTHICTHTCVCACTHTPFIIKIKENGTVFSLKS